MENAHFNELTLAEMRRIASALMSCIAPPCMIGLSGSMGAGKTTLVRECCEWLGSKDWVNSPTYAIIQPYTYPKGRILHVDLYRCPDPVQVDHLDIPSLLTADSIAFVEWVEHGPHLPVDIDVTLEIDTPSTRSMVIKAPGDLIRALNNAYAHELRTEKPGG